MKPRYESVRLPLSWAWIQKVRETVEKLLADVDADLRDSAVLVASELAENVVKYGEPIESEETGEVKITLADGRITITSLSGLGSAETAAEIVARVHAIAAGNARDLYVARLKSLFEGAAGASSSELGLLRIVFEGGFRLSAKHRDGVLQITAERAVP